MQNSIEQQREEILEQIISRMPYRLATRHDDSFSFEANEIPFNILRIDDNGVCHITMRCGNEKFAYRLFNTQDRSVEESVNTAIKIMEELEQSRIPDLVEKLSNKLEIKVTKQHGLACHFIHNKWADNYIRISKGMATICIADKNGRYHNIKIDIKKHNDDYVVNQIVAIATGMGTAQHSLKKLTKKP